MTPTGMRAPGLPVYVATLVLSLAAVIGRGLLESVLVDRARFLVPLVVVVIAAAAGGRGPALLAAVVSGIGTLVVARVVGGSHLEAELLPALAFVLGVAAVILLTERLRLARASAEGQATRLAEVVADRDRALAREARERDLAERRARILEASQEIALTVTAPSLPPAVAERVLDVALAALEAATGAIYLLDERTEVLRLAAIRGYPPGIEERFATLPLSSDLWFIRVARTGVSAWLEHGDERRAAMPPEVAIDLTDVGGAAALVLQASGRTYGIVTVGLPPGRSITPDDRAFIGLVARKIGQALDRARLEEAQRAADRAERERAAQLRAVLETIDDGIAVVAGERVILRNAALDRLTGMAAGSLEELARALGVDRAAVVEHRGSRQVERAGEAGDRRWLAVGAHPVDDGGDEPETLVVVRDVTDARTELAVRDAFVGMLSHELRTPVTVILATAGVLRRRIPADAATGELVDDIASESERMNRLIDDLLVLSRPDAPPITHPEPVLVHHVVERVVAGAARRNPDARLSVDAPPGMAPAAGDPTLVEQVVRNLVGNAIKYAGPRPTVRVAARERDGWIEVAVEDDGPGVPEPEREAIFDIFFRSRSTVGRAGGAGIGLFVCRRLVEAMGGVIAVTSGSMGGARFEFDIPAWSGSSEDAADSAPTG